MMNDVLGETIRSDSQTLEVECHRLYEAPAFGSFVRADCPGGCAHFAVVTHVSTGPFDGNRIVQAHRLAPGELEERKPHLTTLLRTTLQARVVGYGQGEVCVTGTPPSPARLHCFVSAATAAEIRTLTGSPGFLRPLAQTPDVPLEDLLVAAIQAAASAWDTSAPVVAWGKYLARLLRHDYVTLEGALQRLSPAGPGTAAIAHPQARGAASPRWESPLPFTGNGRARQTSSSADPFEED